MAGQLRPAPCPCAGFTPCATASHALNLVADFDLQWRLCPPCFPNTLGGSISFSAIVPSSSSWFGLGFRPLNENDRNSMKHTDMFIGLLPENTMHDYWCTGRVPQLDTVNNLFNMSSASALENRRLASHSNDQTKKTSFQWSRHLNTKDSTQDHALSVDVPMEWIWTLQTITDSSHPPAMMPKKRGKFQLRLIDHAVVGDMSTTIDDSNSASSLSQNAAGSKGLQNVKLAHGVIMGIGWGFFMPLSALAARYTRPYRAGWLNEHVALTKIGAAGTISFIIVAIAAGEELGNFHAHAFIGVVFALFVLLVTISGSLSKAGLKNEAKNRSSNTFRYCRVFHIVIGWMLMFVAFYQIPLGVEVLFSGFGVDVLQIFVYEALPDGSLRENIVLRIVIIIVCVIFVSTVAIFEGSRWKNGYYVKAGGCCATCGKLSKDPKMDAFLRRTKNRFTSEHRTCINSEHGKTTETDSTTVEMVEITAKSVDVPNPLTAATDDDQSTRNRSRNKRSGSPSNGRGSNRGGGRGGGRSSRGRRKIHGNNR